MCIRDSTTHSASRKVSDKICWTSIIYIFLESLSSQESKSVFKKFKFQRSFSNLKIWRDSKHSTCEKRIKIQHKFLDGDRVLCFESRQIFFFEKERWNLNFLKTDLDSWELQDSKNIYIIYAFQTYFFWNFFRRTVHELWAVSYTHLTLPTTPYV